MNVFFDIETKPGQPEGLLKQKIAETIKAPGVMKKQETIDAWHNGDGKYAGEKDAEIDSVYRKTSFDGAIGQIINIAWAVNDDEIKSVGGPDVSE